MAAAERSDEDDRLWRSAMADVVPLRDRRPPPGSESPPASADAPNRVEPPRPRPASDPYTPSLNRSTARRLSSGRLKPDARIDLHGCSLRDARKRVDQSVGAALAAGQRLLLVITGRGGGKLASAEPLIGPIRANLEHWIRDGPHRREIVDVRQAHRSHGGEGAFYVYLRKRRVEGARGFEPRTR